MLRKITCLFIISILFGCATPGTLPTQTNINRSQIYNAPFNDVWEAIIEQIAESNLSITTLERDSGIIAISNSNYDPSWAEEGTRGETLGVPDVVTQRVANFNIFAKEEGQNEIKVRVNTSFRMLIRSGNGSEIYPFNSTWYDSYSNGTLERLILEGISHHL